MKIKIGLPFEFETGLANEAVSATLYLRANLQPAIIIPGEVSAGVARFSADDTSSWTPGEYDFEIIVDGSCIFLTGKATASYTLAAMPENFDSRSKNVIIIEALTAAIENRATSAQSNISIGDKRISYMTLDELIKARRYFVQAEASKNGENIFGKKVRYVFGGDK